MPLTDPLCLKHPIILIHGLGARSTYGPFEYFHGLSRILRNAGNSVFIVNLTSWHTIEHRANQLKQQIEKAFPDDKKVNLIGHSMGGLDARYLTSQLGFADRIASVTTIGTPNRGTIMGDIAAGLLPDSAFLGATKLLKFMDSTSIALKQITRQHCTGDLALLTPNMPQVAYFSATSAISKPVITSSLPIFWIPHRILSALEGENDGFVSVESAQWGEHICTYAGDHYAQIGQFLGRSRGMDYVQFYHDIFKRLKKEGM